MITANPQVMNGALLTGQGSRTMLDITANTVVKTLAGRVVKVAVLVAGSAAGGVYDAKTVAGSSVTNQIAVIPNTVGVYSIDIPTFNGIVVEPGTGQTVVISYS